MEIIYDLPQLYILSNKSNKQRFWKIWIAQDKNKIYYIYRKYGTINGKITENKKLVQSLKKGITEINFLWRKKKESGFEEESSKSKMKSSVIKPMGAHKLDDYIHKIKYPACVQYKLDGFRCISHIQDNNVIMFSKGMKEFIYLNHIKNEISMIKILLNDNNIYLDGELYEHNLSLHQISSLVMKKYASKENEENMKKISYYIFDIFNINQLHSPFKDRNKILRHIFSKYKFNYLKYVECVSVENLDEIYKLNNQFIIDGYEGVIVRNLDGIYKLNGRSFDVLRTKEFKKKEFKIIGAKESIGTHKGAILWNLECTHNKNRNFWAMQKGTIKERINIYKKYIKNPMNYIGQYVNVKYIDIDKDGCVIRNPIVDI